MKRIKNYSLIFALSMSILFLSCNNDPVNNDPFTVALSTNNTYKGIRAVKKLSDQDMLKQVAIHAKMVPVRVAAVENDNWKDMSVLVQIILESEDPSAPKFAALMKLAKLAKLQSSMVIDIRSQNLIKYHDAFTGWIKGEDYRRLIPSILPTMSVLCDSDVIENVGYIDTIKVSRWKIEQNYKNSLSVPGGVGKLRSMEGEVFECSIQLKNIPKTISHTWRSNFPSRIKVYKNSNLYFMEAKIDNGDLLDPVFDQLSQDLLIRFANKDYNKDVRIAAIKKLTDQSLLSKIALEEGWEVRTAVDREVRSAVINKLTDKFVLANIAINDEDRRIREIAEMRKNLLNDSIK